MEYYGMSETGSCSRVLSAQRLGQDPKPKGESSLERLKHYSRLEAVAAERLYDEPFIDVVEDAGLCTVCNNGRAGFHIEIDEGLYKLIGHIDRKVILKDGRRLPVEIKSLGPASWKIFQSSNFAHSMGYAYQECCYLHHEKSPGIYWVMNRDTGQILKYIINDFKNEYLFQGFERVTLPIKYDQIIDKLNIIELDVAENKLSVPEPNNYCFFCDYSYLCAKDRVKNSPVIVDNPEIDRATTEYKEATAQIDLNKDLQDKAKAVLLNFAKTTKTDRFGMNNVTFSYHGMKSKVTTDDDLLEKMLKELTMKDSSGKEVTCDDIIKAISKKGKPFESYTVKISELA